MTIFDSIRTDHETQRTLVAQLLETHGESDGRAELFERLEREMTSHAGAEERYFYIPLLDTDTTQEQARHSVAEHHELEELLEALHGYDMSGPQWIQTAREMCERLTHHLEEEEKEVFPVAGRVLDEDEKDRLAREYEADMERRRAE